MVVSTAEYRRLDAGDGSEQIVELMSAGIRGSLDPFPREHSHGGGAFSDFLRGSRFRNHDFVRSENGLFVIRHLSGGRVEGETEGNDGTEKNGATTHHGRVRR